MFESFQLKSCGAGLLGYRWEAADPVAVVCLIHGVCEHAGRFDRVAEIFKSHGISTFSFDLRGHGGSIGRRGHIGPRETVLSDVDNLVAYARSAHTGLPIVLYGFSMGGNIALDYRLRGRLSDVPAAYLAVSPWLELRRHIPKLLYRFVRLVAKVKPTFALRAGLSAGLTGNPEIFEILREDRLIHDKISVLTALESYKTAEDLMNGRIAGHGGGRGKPLFLMHGTADRICSVEATRAFAMAERASCAHTYFTEWEGYAHELHNSGPGGTGEAVIAKMTEIILSFARSGPVEPV
jgi:alpha-beta hydrolase superfamily lysophospholipase